MASGFKGTHQLTLAVLERLQECTNYFYVKDTWGAPALIQAHCELTLNVSLERSIKVFKAYCELGAYSWPTFISLKLTITCYERMWSVLLAYCELTVNVG